MILWIFNVNSQIFPLFRQSKMGQEYFLMDPQEHKIFVLTKGYHRNLNTLTSCTGMERALTSQDPNLTSPYLAVAQLKGATCSQHRPPDPRPTRS